MEPFNFKKGLVSKSGGKKSSKISFYLKKLVFHIVKRTFFVYQTKINIFIKIKPFLSFDGLHKKFAVI